MANTKVDWQKNLGFIAVFLLIIIISLALIFQGKLRRAQFNLTRTLKTIDTLQLIRNQILLMENEIQLAFIIGDADSSSMLLKTREQIPELQSILRELLFDDQLISTYENIEVLIEDEINKLETLSALDGISPKMVDDWQADRAFLFMHIDELNLMLDEQLVANYKVLMRVEQMRMWLLSSSIFLGIVSTLNMLFQYRTTCRQAS